MILGYLPITAPETLKKQKIVIILVGQEYKFTKSKHDYRTRSGIIYEDREAPIEIGKFKNNYNKERKPRYFNCNIYGHITKDCQKPRKEKETRKCYKYNKVKKLSKKLQKRTKNEEQKHTRELR